MASGLITLDALNGLIRLRGDFVNSGFVTDSELNGWISGSAKELYDLLISTDPDFQSVSATAVTTGGPSIPLPEDFYKLKGVDVAYTTDTWISVKPFTFSQRNKFSLPSISGSFLWQRRIRYRLLGNTLQLIPTPPAGQTIKLWYVPRSPAIQDSGTIAISSLMSVANLNDSITINGESFGMVTPYGSQLAQINFAGGAGTSVPEGSEVVFGTRKFYTVGGTATLAAQADWQTTHVYSPGAVISNTVGGVCNVLYTAAGGTSGGSRPALNSTFGATFSDGSVTWTVWGYGTGATALATSAAWCTQNTSLSPSAWSTGSVTGISGVVSATNISAAAAYSAPAFSGQPWYYVSSLAGKARMLAAKINERGATGGSALWGLTAAGDAYGVVTITGGPVLMTSAAATYSYPVGSWSPTFDGYGGWEEYVIEDCLMKFAIKDEADPTPAAARKAEIRERIVHAAQNRDTTGPDVFSDVESSDFWGWSREY
jgi:hypothetical protein